MPELIEMERQRRRRQAEPFTDLTGRQPVRPGLDQQSEHIKAGLLCECRQGGYGPRFLHTSIIMEM